MMERVLKSKYKITNRLHEDAISATYRGKTLDGGRAIVVKIYKRAILDSVLIKSLHRKISEISKIDHPAAAGILDGDYGWQGFYFVREYVDGKNLEQFLKEENNLTPDAIINISIQICEALSCSHRKGMAHGSLKSTNVIILDDKRVKVTDFGIESAVRATLRQRADMVFKDARYISPEEVAGVFNKKSSDIFKMGLILYLMLAGEPPFGNEKGLKAALKYLKEKIVLPPSRKQNIPKFLEEITLKALERDPILRFSSVDEMMESLKARVILMPKTIEVSYSKINVDEPAEVKTKKIDSEKKRWKIFEKKVTLAVILAIIAGIIYAFIQVFLGR